MAVEIRPDIKMNNKIKEHLDITLVELDNFIDLGKKIFEQLDDCKYLYQAYRNVKVKESQGEKALKIYLAYLLGKKEGRK